MMQQAVLDGQIPQEIFAFAKKYSHCDQHAVPTKQFFCDSSRVLHHPVGLGKCDFRDCYDQVVHPPTSITLQAWGIPTMAIRVLLLTMKTLKYVFKIGFSELEYSYKGTVEKAHLGLGQGSGALPMGFMALSSPVINVCCKLVAYNARGILLYIVHHMLEYGILFLHLP